MSCTANPPISAISMGHFIIRTHRFALINRTLWNCANSSTSSGRRLLLQWCFSKVSNVDPSVYPLHDTHDPHNLAPQLSSRVALWVLHMHYMKGHQHRHACCTLPFAQCIVKPRFYNALHQSTSTMALI